MAAMLDLRIFPPTPERKAEWAPIYIEPMHGSGERLAAAVAVVDASGSFLVDLTLSARSLRCMYGNRGELVIGIAELVQETLQDHLAMGGVLCDWVPPVQSCFLGPLRTAVGTDLQDIAVRAAALTASLSRKNLEDIAQDPQELSATAPEVDRWLQQIRGSVQERAERLDARFNREVLIRDGASPTRIGYLGDRIAANFDSLVPGPNLSTRRHRSKSRLLDLQILKDQIDLFGKRETYELMLWVPEKHSLGFSPKQLETAYAALSELEEFGDKHELRVLGLHHAVEAADRILALEAAT